MRGLSVNATVNLRGVWEKGEKRDAGKIRGKEDKGGDSNCEEIEDGGVTWNLRVNGHTSQVRLHK